MQSLSEHEMKLVLTQWIDACLPQGNCEQQTEDDILERVATAASLLADDFQVNMKAEVCGNLESVTYNKDQFMNQIEQNVIRNVTEVRNNEYSLTLGESPRTMIHSATMEQKRKGNNSNESNSPTWYSVDGVATYTFSRQNDKVKISGYDAQLTQTAI